MRSIKLYRDAERILSLIWYHAEKVIFSKWGVLFIAWNWWAEAPSYFRRLIKDSLVILAKNLIIAPVFADRSKTLYRRFIEKRRRKLGGIYVEFWEWYTMKIVTWRLTVVYYRQEPYHKSFIILTVLVIWYYISEHMFIYQHQRVLQTHLMAEKLSFNTPDRIWRQKDPQRLNRRLNRWFLQRPPRNRYLFAWFQNRLHGYWSRGLHYKIRYVYFSANHFMWSHPIRFYLFVTVYYYFAIWYYHEEMYPYMTEIFYGTTDDWFKVVDDDDVPGGDTIIILGSRWLVSWLCFIIWRINFKYYFSWNTEVVGKLYDFNTKLIYDQKFRRFYWFKYNVAGWDMIPGVNPPYIYWTVFQNEIEDYHVQYNKDIELWYFNYERRLIKNRWPISKLRAWWPQTPDTDDESDVS